MAYAKVTNPPNASNHTYMDPASVTVGFSGVNPYSWKVEVGYSLGANDIYPGTEILTSSGLTDNGVTGLPDSSTTCYTKVKYRLASGGSWRSIPGNETNFTCI